jgi:hypothetical protein
MIPVHVQVSFARRHIRSLNKPKIDYRLNLFISFTSTPFSIGINSYYCLVLEVFSIVDPVATYLFRELCA